ncbi:hypothetical protein ACFWNK_33880 [Streptomyces sp. NPDC058417]|uniref:hypothetical protein n=1 Tax=unclassified Streptomyces TaxID=2593676 RepID=UPI00365B0437
MDVIFYLAPGLIAALALFTAWRTVSQWARLRGAWTSGLTAEARCLRTYTTARGGGDRRVRTVLHHVYEFTAPDGRVVRFEEEDGPGTTLEGDFVRVHWADHAGGPDVIATARPPRHGRQALTALGVLAFLGMILVCCVGFVVTYATTFG